MINEEISNSGEFTRVARGFTHGANGQGVGGQPTRKMLYLSEAAFSGILSIAIDAIISVDDSQTIILFNEGAERIFGYSQAEILGQSLDLLIPERFRSAHRRYIQAFVGSGIAARHMAERREIFALCKNGQEFPAEASISQFESQDHKILTVVLRDITERKRIEDELRQAHDQLERRVRERTAELEKANVALQAEIAERKRMQEEREHWLAREQAARAQVEKSAAILRGLQTVTEVALAHLSLDQLLNELLSHIRELLTADTAAILLVETGSNSLVVRATKGLEEAVEQRIRIPIGQGFAGRIAAERRPIMIPNIAYAEEFSPVLPPKGIRSLLGVPLIMEGQVIGVLHVGTLRPRVFTEDDIQLLQLIADRVALAIDHAELYEGERTARAQAEAANRTKDEFLATVSHELRTPLTSILGWATMLLSHKLDEARSTRALETIERNARAQAQIIEDLLDVSRIISGKLYLKISVVDLASVIHTAIESVRPAAEAKEIRIRTILDFGPNLVAGDPERLRQVIGNLLSNSIKFTPKGGRVDVLLERIASRVEIKVSDTGQGVDPEFLPYVFDRFRQADSSVSRQHGGLGLGLAIARHLVELHGGQIRAESRGSGQGTTIAVELPLRAASVEPSLSGRSYDQVPVVAPEVGHRALAGLRVLVVDDEADARELISTVLAGSGAEVITASSTAEALVTLERWQPELLVSDIGLPGEDGYTLIEKVRALTSKSGSTVPAVALTAYARIEDRMRVLASGYQMHVSKPVEPDELVAVIASLAGRDFE